MRPRKEPSFHTSLTKTAPSLDRGWISAFLNSHNCMYLLLCVLHDLPVASWSSCTLHNAFKLLFSQIRKMRLRVLRFVPNGTTGSFQLPPGPAPGSSLFASHDPSQAAENSVGRACRPGTCDAFGGPGHPDFSERLSHTHVSPATVQEGNGWYGR